jgi:AcrR family transcriptional regulator
MTRRSKRDWLEAGFATLGESGASALTINGLCQRLSLTKGSFYHHFKNIQDYREELLAFWEEKLTERIIASSQEGAHSPTELFARFLQSLMEQTPQAEIAIRAWALQDETVRAYVARIDGARLAQGRQWFATIAADEEQAYTMSRLFHTILVGSYTVIPPVEGPELGGLVGEFLRLYGLDIGLE